MVTLTRKRALLGLVFCLMYVAKIDVSDGSRCILVYVKGKPGNPVIRALVLFCNGVWGFPACFFIIFSIRLFPVFLFSGFLFFCFF